MGCGKSVVGPLLARRLKMDFADLDIVIVRQSGRTIPQLFEKGEESFRRAEAQALRRLCAGKARVIALGGGALLRPGNRKAVAASGRLVRLTCSEPELWRRLKPELHRRPLLAGPKPRQALKSLIDARRGACRGARISVSTTRRTPGEAAKIITDALG